MARLFTGCLDGCISFRNRCQRASLNNIQVQPYSLGEEVEALPPDALDPDSISLCSHTLD